jgi:hypothetical protein
MLWSNGLGLGLLEIWWMDGLGLHGRMEGWTGLGRTELGWIDALNRDELDWDRIGQVCVGRGRIGLVRNGPKSQMTESMSGTKTVSYGLICPLLQVSIC